MAHFPRRRNAASFALGLGLALLAPRLAAAAGPDVDQILQKRPPIDVVDVAILSSLDRLTAMVNDELERAGSTDDKVLALENLLKIKDAQLEDAKKLSGLVTKQVEDTEKTVLALRNEATARREGSAKLSERLKAQISEEDKLQGRIEKEKKDILKLEESLDEIRREANEPQLARWVERRIGSVGSAIDDRSSVEELGKAAYNVVQSMGRTVDYVESTASVNPLVAFFLSGLLLVLPLAAGIVAVSRLSRSISYKQHLLVGYIFNLFFAFSCATVSFFGGYDPLVQLHLTAPVRWFLLVTFFVLQWPVLLSFLLYSGAHAKSSNERRNFGYQIILFLSVCYNVLRNTYAVASSKSAGVLPGSINMKSYVLYVLSFISLIVMTVLSAEDHESGLVGDVRGYMFEESAAAPTSSPRRKGGLFIDKSLKAVENEKSS